MPYETFTAVEFALDEPFRHWIRSPAAEDNEFWASFLTQHPEKRADVMEARLLVSRLRINAETASSEQLEQLWGRIQAGTQTNPANVQTERTRVVSLWRNRAIIMRWAAVWGGLLLLTGLAYYRFGYAPATRYETAYGETKTITLPDGSTVTLNGHSTLSLRTNWNDQRNREVTLAGEAFFAVTKRKNADGQPLRFRVRTTGLRIDVLGTRFNVNHRRNKTEVVLEEGRVQVSGDETINDPVITQPTLMQPGDMLTYFETSHKLTKVAVNPEAFTSWLSNLLIFKDKPVVEIAQVLSDNYGIEVDFQNPTVATKRFSGSVPTDSVAVFFRKLETLYGVTVRRSGRRYVID